MIYLLVRYHKLFNIVLSKQLRKSSMRSLNSGDNLNKILLSVENRQRCMKKMLQYPSIGVKLRGVKSENKFASILIALCVEEEKKILSVLYTRRSHLLSRHMRQISFPGGIKEDDEDFVECALRETREEIGLPPHRVDIWGSGKIIALPLTAAITPVVGVINNFKETELKLNSAEVEEVFTIPIKQLANPQALCYTQFKSGYSAPVFVIDTKRIWGVTGLITNIFMNCFLPPELNELRGRVKYIKSYKPKTL